MTEPLFPKALRGRSLFDGTSDDYDLLPEAVKSMHDFEDEIRASGTVDIVQGEGLLPRLIARIFRFPEPTKNGTANVHFIRAETCVLIVRQYAAQRFVTAFYDWPEAGYLLERYGPFWLKVEGVCRPDGLTFLVRKFWFLRWLPIPLKIAPIILAQEGVLNGKYSFLVDIHFPIIGRVIAYQGTLMRSD